MKKVLLYYPKISNESDAKDIYTGLPLSVMTLAAQMDELVYDVKIIDGRLQNYIGSPELKEWMENDLLLIGISAMTGYQLYDGLQLAKWAKETLKLNVPLVWGGWHSSLMPDQVISHPLADIVVIGQGEAVLPILLDKLNNHMPLDEVPNLVFKNKEGTHKTKKREQKQLGNFKSILNAHKYVDTKRYIGSLWGHEKVIGYESSRGCPWHCKYCSISSVYRKNWTALPANIVVNDLKVYKNKFGIDAVHFYDNNFFVDEKRALAFSEKMISEEVGLYWDGTVTVNQFLSLSESKLNLLKKSGLFRVIMGIESGDPDVLQRINKNHSVQQVLDAVKKCTDYGIMPSLSFMIGFPWNPEKDAKLTMDLIEKINYLNGDAEVLLFVFTPYCGTEMYSVAQQYGMSFPTTLEAWSTYTYDKINTPWISKELKRKINRYLSFFGTKELSSDVKRFYRNEDRDQ